MADTTSRSLPLQRQGITTQTSAKRQEGIAGLVFVSPALLILFMFLIVPLVVALYFSLTNWNGRTPLSQEGAYEYIGLRNYEQLLIQGRRVDDFYNALKNTVYYVLGVVPTQTIIALVLAVIVNQRWLKFRGFFRTAYYFPSITSSIVVSMIFLFLFSNTGPVNGLLSSLFPNYQPVSWLSNNDGVIHNLLGLFGITRDSSGFLRETQIFRISLWEWISGPSVSMLTIMILAIWTTIGTMMVVYLAALQNIPSQVYEAAQVDGANAWQVFRHITMPLLRPTTFFVVTLGLIGTFQVFDQIYVLRNDTTRRTTMSVAYLVYDFAFGSQTDPRMDRATATAITLFVIIFVATIIQRRLTGGDKANA
ncbi:MAG: sugar ABC transporter permease [Chloroflexota bacterium]|nr:MAG: sugar ABC transporter permease [Chloroflexota bacterium]